jgi:hypothetical protein
MVRSDGNENLLMVIFPVFLQAIPGNGSLEPPHSPPKSIAKKDTRQKAISAPVEAMAGTKRERYWQ